MLQSSQFRKWKQLKNYQNAIILLILMACLALYWWLALGGNNNLLTPAGLKATIHEFSPFSPLIYMGILALSVIISPIPGAPLVVAGGAVWEFPLGGLYSVMGGFVGGLVAYSIGRTLGNPAIQALTGRAIQWEQTDKEKYAAWFVFFTRLLPVLPFGFISYGSGIAKLPAQSYAIATLLGMTPPTLMFSYLGQSLTTSIMGTILVSILLLILLVGLPLGMRRWNVSLPGLGSSRELFNQFITFKGTFPRN